MGVGIGAMRIVAALEDKLRSHLDSGEKLLWAGRPVQGVVLTRQDWYLIPFSVLLVAVGLRFISMGVCILIVGRLFTDLWYRSRLFYGVTIRRAIILSGRRRRSVQSIYISSLITLKLEERRNRSGTIYFGEDYPSYRHDTHDGSEFGTYAPSGQTRLGEEQFFRITDAKKVFTILHEAMQRQRKISDSAVSSGQLEVDFASDQIDDRREIAQ
jgi:hypothetical protein